MNALYKKSKAHDHSGKVPIENVNTIDESRSKVARTSLRVFGCDLSPIEMAIENTVSSDFWSTAVDC